MPLVSVSQHRIQSAHYGDLRSTLRLRMDENRSSAGFSRRISCVVYVISPHIRFISLAANHHLLSFHHPSPLNVSSLVFDFYLFCYTVFSFSTFSLFCPQLFLGCLNLFVCLPGVSELCSAERPCLTFYIFIKLGFCTLLPSPTL